MITVVLVVMTLCQVPTTTLAGTVVDQDGKPVVGAELVLTNPKPGEAPVVARGKSGEGGRFNLDRPAGLAATDRYLVPVLWAIAPGHRVGVMRFAGALPGPDEFVRVSLGPPGKTAIRVESPERAPVVGARLSVQQIKSEVSTVPDPVADIAERATGPDGVAILDAFSPEQVGWVDVIAKGYGIQPRWLDPESPGLKRVTFIPVIALSGRLVPENVDPKLVKGWRVRAWTRGPGTDPPTDTSAGYGSTTTDDEGRFVLPELAPGWLSLTVVAPDESDLLPDLSNIPPVRQHRGNAIEIPIRRSAAITGLVRERDTGKPVAGMRVVLFRPGQSSGVTVSTDAEGRYSFQSLAGKARVWPSEAPSGFVLPSGRDRELIVPAGPARVEVAVIELTRAAPALRGRARDEAGRAVAGANIAAEWVMSEDGQNWGNQTRVIADADGFFAVEGLAPGARVKITARYRDRATVRPVEADAGSREPLEIVLSPKPVVAVAGRVLGPGGVPLAGAVVTIRGRKTGLNHSPFPMPVQLDGNPSIRTGTDGTFRTPRELERLDHDYQAEVSIAGYHPARTPFVAVGAGEIVTLPDVVLRRLQAIRAVTGRVVDRDGRPIRGASVSQSGDGPSRTATTTDDDGRFRLAGFYEGAGLIFAEKAGFRFGGAIVGQGNEPVAITFARDGEPPLKLLKTLPSPMVRSEERALARELLEPVLAGARDGSLGDSGPGAILALARVDSARVLAMLENRVIANPTPVIVQVALGQFEEHPGEAIVTIESTLEPGVRAQGFLSLADAVPAADRARRGEFLDRAFNEASRVSSAEIKLRFFREIADIWFGAGDLARATPILREGQGVIAELPKNDYVYQAEEFAEVLAAIDLPAARAIFERKGNTNTSLPDKATIDRHLAEAAVRIAAFDPVEAERLANDFVGMNTGDREWARYRIARRMARADLTRARKLLAMVAAQPENPVFSRPALVPYGLGLIASDRAATEPAVARGLLDEAFAGLTKIARAAEGETNPSAATLMAALLPVVEKIDPERVAERLWLAASCRPSRLQEPSAEAVLSDAILALRASRYDRAMAAALVAPVFDRLPVLLDRTDGWGFQDTQVFQVLAAHDPRAISRLIPTLPATARQAQRNPNGYPSVAPEALARLAAGRMLGMPIDVRRREATGSFHAPASDELTD
jgi:Carboxypeptidase regulatory-like domain